MKKPVLGAALVFLCAAAVPAALAEENRYDVFAQTLAPLVSLLANDTKTKAMTAEIQFLSAIGLNPKVPGVRASIALNMPDKILLTGITRDDVVTLCRNGQQVWIGPAAPAREILAELAPAVFKAKADREARIADFTLPLPREQLVFLPVLFTIEDAGEQELDGETCRALDVRLMPELAHSLKAEGWVARLWITSGHVLRRVQLQRGHTALLVAVKDLTFQPSLPDSTWSRPASEEVIDVNAHQVEVLIEQLLKYFK